MIVKRYKKAWVFNILDHSAPSSFENLSRCIVPHAYWLKFHICVALENNFNPEGIMQLLEAWKSGYACDEGLVFFYKMIYMLPSVPEISWNLFKHFGIKF